VTAELREPLLHTGVTPDVLVHTVSQPQLPGAAPGCL